MTLGKSDAIEVDAVVVTAYLSFLAYDMQDNPSNIQPINRNMLARAEALVRDVDVDLNLPLSDD